MDEYIQLNFPIEVGERRDRLIAELAGIGFEGFEEDETELKAFMIKREWDQQATDLIVQQFGTNYKCREIPPTNWNQQWESSFEPVLVGDFVAVRAYFHSPVKNVKHEIVITPKMSFGTGHHATTYLMMQAMRQINFQDQAVFDFGTGTGVLAILAERMGASSVLATDIDPWCIENAEENRQRNRGEIIELKLSGSAEQGRVFDVILANINKHIILQSLPFLVKQMGERAMLLLSGLLVEDEAEIQVAASLLGLRVIDRSEKANWLCLKLSY